MNSLFKSLHKHVWSVLLIVLLSLLFTGCPKPSGSNNEGDESGSTSYTPSVREMFATKAVINFCTVDEMKELYRYEYDLFEGDNLTAIKHEWRSDSTDFWIYIHAGEYRIKPLNPNTKYTLKIKYNLKSGETIDKTLEFTTKAYDFSDITIEYDADIYKKVIIESDEYYLDSSYDASIKIYRSETADGEYKEVSASQDSSSDSIKYYDDDKLESNKTYYYKLKVVKNNSDQVLFESAEPKSVTIGVVIPGKVDEDSIKISNGITAVKVEWEPVVGADCYIFSFGNRTYVSSFTANIVAAKEVTTTSYIVEGLEPGSDYTLKISAKNEGGTSREAAQKTFTLTEPSITGFKKVIGQEEAEFHINPSYDFVPEDCTVTYHMEDSLDNVIVADTSEPVLKRTGLTIEEKYTEYLYLNYSYKDSEGNTKTGDSYKRVEYYTNGFEPPSEIEIKNTGKTTITIAVGRPPVKTYNGKSLYTHCYVYYGDSRVRSVDQIKTDSSDYEIGGLSSGRDYTIKVFTSKYSIADYSSYKGERIFLETEATTQSGFASKPIIKSVAEKEGDRATHPLLSVEWNKMNEDDGENVAYEVEYKVLKKSKYSKFINLDNPLEENGVPHGFVNTYKAEMPVNAGNRYFVRIVAYAVDEPACKVYSEEQTIQLEEYDDRSLVTALTYPQKTSTHEAGDVIDFTDPNVWTLGKAPRSTRNEGYNIGVTQFMGAASNDKYALPAGQVDYFAFKYSFGEGDDKGIDASYIPRLIFLDNYSFQGGTDITSFGKFGEIYIVEPDNEGSFVKVFEDPSYDTNMAWFTLYNGQYTSLTAAASSGIPIEESWIFNNSVYIGVQQIVAGDLGFSYFY